MSRSTWRPLAVLLGALGVVAAITVAGAGITTTDQNDPSSHSGGKLGTLALYSWFHDLGLQVHRVSGSFDTGGTDVLMVYDPTVAFTAADVASVRALLRGGGDVVVVTDAATVGFAEPLLNALGADASRPIDTGVARPAQLFDSTQRVKSVPVGPGYSFGPQTALVPLLEVDGDTAAAATRSDGGGRAYGGPHRQRDGRPHY